LTQPCGCGPLTVFGHCPSWNRCLNGAGDGEGGLRICGGYSSNGADRRHSGRVSLPCNGRVRSLSCIPALSFSSTRSKPLASCANAETGRRGRVAGDVLKSGRRRPTFRVVAGGGCCHGSLPDTCNLPICRCPDYSRRLCYRRSLVIVRDGPCPSSACSCDSRGDKDEGLRLLESARDRCFESVWSSSDDPGRERAGIAQG
jgi:hypothetical protein